MLNNEDSLEKKYKTYKEKVGFHVSYDDFCKPKELLKIHDRVVGTVVKKIDPNLRIYDHIIYFGCMLFFTNLTDQQIKNGPIVFTTLDGQACCL